MSNLSKYLSTISPNKLALLSKQIESKSTKTPTKQVIARRNQSDEVPLSFAQQRLWFLAQLEPENPFYNQPTALKLHGELNIAVLKQSLTELIRRHEPLRTTFSSNLEGKTKQIIHPPREVVLPTVNLEQLNPSQQEQQIKQLASLEAQKVFNLEQDQPLRVTLLKLSPSEHIIFFTTHHIITDEWSIGILVKEISTLYQAYLEEKTSPLPELAIQYADFALWQREWLTGEVVATQLNYWQQQLESIPRLDLPTDYLRPVNTTYQGASHTFDLSPSLSTGIKALAQSQGTTLFMTLLAAFKLLLSRYSGQEDIPIGTPIANRNRAEIEGLIGFFVNTLVLRTNLEGNLSFTELLQRVKEITLGAYTHQDIPFEQLVEELKVERNLNRNPLFDVMFTIEQVKGEELSLPGLSLSYLDAETNKVVCDLTLSIAESEAGLVGAIEYSTELFQASTIERMVAHFQVLLEAIISNPEVKLSEIPLLTSTEREQLLVEWNDTKVEYPQEQCIHELFEEQVEKTPDAVALVYEDQYLTYRELNNRANQLAHYLQQEHGVQAEVLVGICVERSLEMTVAILAILKSGGAYIPIDPNYPTQRITEIIEDAGIEILLIQQQLETKLNLQAKTSLQLLSLDSSWSDIANQSTDDCHSQVSSANLAYVIYTSGSTGKPKGVAVTHTALVNYTLEIAQQFELEETDRVLQFASVGFDVVVEELFPTWITGATVVLLENNQLISCSEFQQVIGKEQLTVFELPTAYWHQWVLELASNQEQVADCVRLVIVGGERISGERFKQWQQLSTPLIHVYGLTETTVTSTLHKFNRATEELEAGRELPIGKPIGNTEIYLLDNQLQPVPVGVSGEIYIGGAGIARGYLNLPELTADRFIPNPFSTKSTSRLYKTGDKGRYLENGEIEYIGRIDHQVKLRGFRIELGEIEAALNQNLVVANSVVIVREDLPGNQQLVAYLTAKAEQKIEIAQLRSYLAEKLPGYMIPSAFVELEALPLTPNGKIDRKALPVPDSSQLVVDTEYVAPTTSLEKMLVGIWQEILGIKQAGINDNFFELGGHSLLLTQLIGKLKHAFQIELPLRILYESPTVASLAEKIEIIFQNGFSNAFREETLIDLNAEAILDSNIFPKTEIIKFNSEPTSIFLTGATGFLGAFLLYELLQQTQADIYCLVRSKNLEEGKQKLQDALKSYLIWEEKFSRRIIPVAGDLAKPLFGLTEEQFQELANTLDIIYHNGAWVHHLYPYSVLKPANVLGTQEIIRLAYTNKVKPLHYVSTPDVFSATGYSEVRLIKEQDSIDREQVPADGYTQTKWVAEKLIKTAEQRGLPVCIYRPGRISGHSQTGVFNSNDFLHKLTIGCIELGSAPEGNLIENIVPVDYVSQAIVYLSRQKKSVAKAFHILNPQHDYIDKLVRVARSFGFSVQQISYKQWQEKLMNIASSSPNHPLYSLVPFFPQQEFESEETNSAELEFDCQNTINGLVEASISCPEISEQLIGNYFSCAIQARSFENYSINN
jgi:amino acid adenylation domain-containing protein/thioester reductase-like protein